MEVGMRIIYDIENGFILNSCSSERVDMGLTQEMYDKIRPSKINFIDISYGDTNNKIILSVDVITKAFITKDVVKELTLKEKRIIELAGVA